ncbi:hypothetical protein R6Q59_007205 [Mikania micrantha]
MALLAFCPTHNLVAELSAEHDADFAPIISFLRRSMYFFTLTFNHVVYESHHQQFWGSCSIVPSTNGRTLLATIDAHPISISMEIICWHLQLNDAGGRASFTKDEVEVTILSMGYKCPLPSTTYLKGKVSYNYKYLLLVFLHCLSNKRGGWVQIPSDLALAIHVLYSNQPFNFSAFIFNKFANNLLSQKKFFTQAQGTSSIALNDPLSPTSQTILRVVTELQERFPDPKLTLSEVDPGSLERVNTVEVATTDEPFQIHQDSGIGNRTSSVATHIADDFFEVIFNKRNPRYQERTSGDGGA